MSAAGAQLGSPPLLKVSIETVPGAVQEFHFSESFRIGRAEDCQLCIQDEFVSRVHAEIRLQDGEWWVRDLGSSNGVYIGEQRVERTRVLENLTIRLGVAGPELKLQLEKAAAPEPRRLGNRILEFYRARYRKSGASRSSTTPHLETVEKKSPPSTDTVARYVDHYFGQSANDGTAGQHTMYVRQAFAHVQKKQKRKYGKIIAALGLLVVGAGTYAFYEHNQIRKQRATAAELFYTMKSLDLDVANLERVVADSHSQAGAEEIRQYRDRRDEMEKNYDRFLSTLHVYNPKMTEQERLVLRVSRIFGEFELDMPPDFVGEVTNYIKKWQSSDRFAKDIQAAEASGYTTTITRELLAQDLPPQFFYLAMQESNFDPYISGPMTRKGYAKGMWQFIPETAVKYGLHLGPLVDLRRPDPSDERDQYEKATKAAARYLKDLYSTDAQASGFLVMACYNWGEDQVLPLVRSMPANPRERNFWQLLAKHRNQLPQETYDYVFYIVSAAVIGENPRLFGFDFDNPLSPAESK